MRIPLGYKFIFGFLAVVSAVVFVPKFINAIEVPEWLTAPVSVLTAIAIGLSIGSFFTKSFTRDFNRLTQMAKRISLGDIFEFEGQGKKKLFTDETTDLEGALMVVFTNLRTLVERLRDTAERLALAQESLDAITRRGHETSGEVASGAARIFDGALGQARQLELTSTAVKEILALADNVAEKVVDAVNASQKMNSMINRGAAASTSAIEKMEGVFRGMEKTESAAATLKGRLSDVPKILDVITHISRQTDLLALNATIEAAKAGEHGRGFAMVAEEVRRFAENTAQSADDVGRIVRDIAGEIERVVSTAQEGAASVREGRNDIRKIREIFGEITGYTADVAEKARLILAIAERQKKNSEKTASAIEEVGGIARENLSVVEAVDKAVERHGQAIEDTLKASRKLSELSLELKGVVSRFRAQ
jgi:methyl-accepting chemotaxis protein